jgi:hypothetical protein
LEHLSSRWIARVRSAAWLLRSRVRSRRRGSVRFSGRGLVVLLVQQLRLRVRYYEGPERLPRR